MKTLSQIAKSVIEEYEGSTDEERKILKKARSSAARSVKRGLSGLGRWAKSIATNRSHLD